MIPNENDKLENTGENTNFMQIGITIECSSCKPEKGYADYHNVSKCDCKCHDMTQTNSQIREEWRERFDYIFPFQLWHEGGMVSKNEDIKSFIDELLKSQREEMIEKIEKISVFADSGDTLKSRIINLIKKQ